LGLVVRSGTWSAAASSAPDKALDPVRTASVPAPRRVEEVQR
jgi:hypothetical protein